MTDDELLLNALNNIVLQLHDAFDYIKDKSDEINKELAEDYLDCGLILKDILEEVSGIDSLFLLDEEDFAFVYEMLSDYVDNFIVDHRDSARHAEQLAECRQLEKILDRLEENYVPQDYE